jgi:hypothetical protein
MSGFSVAPQAASDSGRFYNDDTAGMEHQPATMKGPNNMPWSGSQFRTRFNKKLTAPQANAAARQATAMVKAGVPDETAIRVANSRIKRLRRRGAISDKAAGNLVHAANKRGYQKYGAKFFKPRADKYAGTDETDRQQIDAATR